MEKRMLTLTLCVLVIGAVSAACLAEGQWGEWLKQKAADVFTAAKTEKLSEPQLAVELKDFVDAVKACIDQQIPQEKQDAVKKLLIEDWQQREAGLMQKVTSWWNTTGKSMFEKAKNVVGAGDGQYKLITKRKSPLVLSA